MNRIPAVLIAVAVALAGAGCGDSGRAEFNAEVKKAFEPIDRSKRNEGHLRGAAALDVNARAMDETVARLRKLDAPDEVQDQFDAFVREIETGADVLRELRSAATSGDEDALDEAQAQLEREFTTIGDKAEAYGTAVDRLED